MSGILLVWKESLTAKETTYKCSWIQVSTCSPAMSNSTPGSALWRGVVIPTTMWLLLKMPGDSETQVCLAMFLSKAVVKGECSPLMCLTLWRHCNTEKNTGPSILTSKRWKSGFIASVSSWEMGSLTQPQLLSLSWDCFLSEKVAWWSIHSEPCKASLWHRFLFAVLVCTNSRKQPWGHQPRLQQR